ncbi:MAG: hypothetical protein B7Y99_11595 [Caulobacterales bacterium 32-69-10]|nr:MAG: hypothetical protein B7Y99_11595 [Caulobacterales bacterium 32-69-10]
MALMANARGEESPPPVVPPRRGSRLRAFAGSRMKSIWMTIRIRHRIGYVRRRDGVHALNWEEMKLRTVSLTFVALTAACLLTACGQPQETAASNAAADAGESATAAGAEGAAGIIKTRQENLKKFGAASKAMQDEGKKSAPSPAVYQVNAATIAELAPQLHSWFPVGTGQEAGVKTAAKPEIWARPDEFKSRADAFAAEAEKFNATVQAGDITAIKAGATELGLACRNCHQTFRQRDE